MDSLYTLIQNFMEAATTTDDNDYFKLKVLENI